MKKFEMFYRVSTFALGVISGVVLKTHPLQFLAFDPDNPL